jgi:hypothetical protein
VPSAFQWLKPFECLRRFYAFGVSMASPFIAALFLCLRRLNGFAVLWLTPFLCLRRLSLRCLNGFAVFCGIICLLSR